VFSNNFFYVKKLLLVSLSMVLISFSFLTVFASANTPEENGFVLVIIRANVDSRVIESQASIRVEFENKDTGNSYLVTLQPYNEYCIKTYLPQGEYRTISGDVANDYNAEYPVHGVSFLATGATVEVTFDVGDPAYIVSATPITDVFQGDFDYNKTNSLLNEDNMETINWSQLNENMDPYNTDPDNPYLGNNTPVSSDEFIGIIPSDTNEMFIGENETTEYSVYENYESVAEAENEGDAQSQKSPAIIILVVVVAAIVAVVLYLKSKKAKSSEV